MPRGRMDDIDEVVQVQGVQGARGCFGDGLGQSNRGVLSNFGVEFFEGSLEI